MKNTFLLLICLVQYAGFCQSTELVLLKGKIVCPIKESGDVNIFNLRSESSTTTDEKGDYTIFVKVGDTLKFTSIQTETKKIVITDVDVAKPFLVTSLVPSVINLDELEIKQYKNINAVSLGILDKPAKKYTPAERKLRTAEELHWYSPLLIPVGGMSVDGLLNAINGRKAMLQKEVEIEKKEKLLLKIENQFRFDYFTKKLKIPKDNVKGFWYYAIEEPKLVEALNTKNKTMAAFVFAELATKYKAILKEGSK